MTVAIGLNKWQEKLNQLFLAPVESMGYEYVGCEYFSQGQHSMVRIYIDKPEGVNTEDCGKVSHQLSAILDVEDMLNHQYTLEVSSPGIERLLFTAEQFKRFVGEKLSLRLHRLLAGKRKLSGVLQQVTDCDIVLEIKGEVVSVPFALIAKAHLAIEF